MALHDFGHFLQGYCQIADTVAHIFGRKQFMK